MLEMRYIAPRKSIALVKVLDRVLILGISDQTITTLGELSPDEVSRLDTEKTDVPGRFSRILSGFTGAGDNSPSQEAP